MLDPTTLFSWEPHVDQRTVHADTMIVTLGSYVDAGHTQRQTDEQLLQHLPNRLLGTFDADQLIDHTVRRPTITFDRNHFTDYAPHRIALHLVTDTDGRDFLLLNGPEPSLQWERMAAAVNHLAGQLDVQQTVLVQTMPAPAPHTRPVVVTPYASDPTLVSTEPVLGTFTLSAAFPGVLTLRMGEAGHPVLGLLAHVPHYISDHDFPPATSAMIEALRDATALRLPTDGLDLASTMVRQQIDAQVSQSEELTAMVEAMERQFDEFTEKMRIVPPTEQQLPSAEEIGAKFEDFLANLGDADPAAGGDADDGDADDGEGPRPS
ncbi:MAG: PAC2 family protein [Propionibacteriaceae bacterium]|nr:PAC2 family protein [Propionibacteriaceae bacterium]